LPKRIAFKKAGCLLKVVGGFVGDVAVGIFRNSFHSFCFESDTISQLALGLTRLAAKGSGEEADSSGFEEQRKIGIFPIASVLGLTVRT